jgi:hypothetical protein
MRAIRRLIALLAFATTAVVTVGCPGDGSDGPAPVIVNRSTPECIVLGASFPSGLTALPTGGREAAAAQAFPPAVFGLDLEREPPALLASQGIPGLPLQASACGGTRVDSDSDGLADADRSDQLGFNCQDPRGGTLRALRGDLVLLASSAYEQVLLFDPRSGRLRLATLETPAATPSFDPASWPFWPAVGTPVDRSGFSTRACVDGSGLVDSLGQPLGDYPQCGNVPDRFFTGFTSDVLRRGDRLFVTTANLLRSSTARFAPGTVLVFRIDDSVDPLRVGPDPTRPVIFTTAFNPTSLARYTTPAGRDLILIGNSGAIALGSGPDLVRTDSAVDVLDPETLTLIATIPLGRGGLGFDGIAIEPSARLGMVGSSVQRALFAIDLAALDDPMLGFGTEPLPIVLDGSTPGWPDARVFDNADPFLLPRRADGPSDSICTTQTSVAIQSDGRFALASDFCDGTLTVLDLLLPPVRATPIDPATVLGVSRVVNAVAPIVDDATGLRAIDRLLIRPGIPGIDFQGPDVHFTTGLPRGATCGIRIDAR